MRGDYTAGMKSLPAFFAGLILGAVLSGVITALVVKHYAIDQYPKDSAAIVGAAINEAIRPGN